jgi:hypothetical protein
MKTKYPEKEYLGIAGLPEFVKSSVELAYNPDKSLFDRVANIILIIIKCLDCCSTVAFWNRCIEDRLCFSKPIFPWEQNCIYANSNLG